MDIGSNNDGAAGRLSNFTERFFDFDGVQCSCLEGPIQAFKFKDPKVQEIICRLSGRDAKRLGRERNEAWQSQQMLWWQGKEYPRDSQEYQDLLDRLYETVAQLPDFQEDLLTTGNAILVHSIGEKDTNKTVLTEEEFCSRLMKCREKIWNGEMERVKESKPVDDYSSPLKITLDEHRAEIQKYVDNGRLPSELGALLIELIESWQQRRNPPESDQHLIDLAKKFLIGGIEIDRHSLMLFDVMVYVQFDGEEFEQRHFYMVQRVEYFKFIHLKDL